MHGKAVFSCRQGWANLLPPQRSSEDRLPPDAQDPPYGREMKVSSGPFKALLLTLSSLSQILQRTESLLLALLLHMLYRQTLVLPLGCVPDERPKTLLQTEDS